jgi:hypothetical protein
MRKKRIVVLVSVALIGTLVFFALGRPEWAQVAQAIPGCTLSDLRGTFSFVVHGTNPAGQPFGEVGTFTADGAGNIAGASAIVDNGVYSTDTFTCTYSMTSDCRFRGPCTGSGDPGPESQFDGALADGNREVKMLLSGIPAVAGGAVVTGEARKQ